MGKESPFFPKDFFNRRSMVFEVTVRTDLFPKGFDDKKEVSLCSKGLGSTHPTHDCKKLKHVYLL